MKNNLDKSVKGTEAPKESPAGKHEQAYYELLVENY